MAFMASMANANPCSYTISNKIPTTTHPKHTFTISTFKHSLKPPSLSLTTALFPSLSFSLTTPLFPPLSLPRGFRLSSASFDGAELGDQSLSAAQQDPETESSENGQQEEEGTKVSKSINGGDSGRLYVGNLPYSMNASQLAQVFGEAGSVVNVEVIYDRVTDRSRGFGFVTMESVEEAQEAIRMFDGSKVGGRVVKVNFPQVPRGGEREVLGPKMRNMNKGYVDSPHKIYAGNLGWNLTSHDLRDTFADQPGVLSARVIYERDTGRSRGFGFISFETAEAAQAALDVMNGVELEGRPLRLNMASERAPPTSPGALEVVNESVDGGELPAGIST